MGRPRKHANAAERQRAHRQRVRERLAGLLPLTAPGKPARKVTRPQRLATVEAELAALLGEYRKWLESLPENFREGDTASQLEEAIEQLETALETVSAIEPPRGFGR